MHNNNNNNNQRLSIVIQRGNELCFNGTFKYIIIKNDGFYSAVTWRKAITRALNICYTMIIKVSYNP